MLYGLNQLRCLPRYDTQVVADLIEKDSQPVVPRSMLQQTVLGLCALALCCYLLVCTIQLQWPFLHLVSPPVQQSFKVRVDL
jgi:hypothetical protein